MSTDEETRLDHARAAPVLRHGVQLRWVEAGAQRSLALAERAVLGSAKHLPVPLVDGTVSRLHAELELREDGLWVKDLGSKNGTWVDSVRVLHARVEPGQTLRLGRTVVEVVPDREATRVELWPHAHFGPLLGGSAAMRALFARLARVAPHDSTVLLHGETGTGKELVAEALHQHSPRRGGPLQVVDCAALPESLLESELFGHARGAFTGAVSARAGAFESADGGTLFLDEIGELPLPLQPRLLRALEARTVRRLGESQYRRFDVRIVAATHRDLLELVNRGAFREDLYFRLAVVPLEVPPLRARREDIAPLARHFAQRFRMGALEPHTLAELERAPWLGNVRELRNAVERLHVLGQPAAVPSVEAPEAPPSTLEGRAPGVASAALPEEVDLSVPFKDLRERWIEHLERVYLRALLQRHGGNISAAAQAAGLDRSYLHRLLRKLGP